MSAPGSVRCLDLDKDGIPVYTLTSESRRPTNVPSPAYKDLIAKALCEEFGLTLGEANDYLDKSKQERGAAQCLKK